jgi:hypothetical protein
MISAPRKRAGMGQLQASGYSWGPKGDLRGRKRIWNTRKKENLEYNSTGDRGFIVGKAARGRDNR